MFQTPGLEHTSASNAGFITGLTVVFTPVLGAVFLGQRIPAIARTAAAVSAAGFYLLSGVGSGLELGGDGLVLLCAIAFAAHILVTARGVAEHDAGALLVVQLAVVGVFCLVVAAASGELTVPRGATVWSALLVTSLVASALGFFVQTYAQRHAPRRARRSSSQPSRRLRDCSAPAGGRAAGPGLAAGRRADPRGYRGRRGVPRLRPPRPLPEG